MGKEIRLNAFDMNCVGHQSPGLWRHPKDRSATYKDLEYWSELALILENGKFDGLFIADGLASMMSIMVRRNMRFETLRKSRSMIRSWWFQRWHWLPSIWASGSPAR
jgi:alkanesulfonate monooxygenase SsuD/methylene tetrahydromethanopterin reductase-like flavin-dependent oxidoreductase (luciferase family)